MKGNLNETNSLPDRKLIKEKEPTWAEKKKLSTNCAVNVCSKWVKEKNSSAYHPMILGHSIPLKDWIHPNMVTFRST